MVAPRFSTTSSLVRLKAAAWQVDGLIRVHVRDGADPVALPSGSTVLEVAEAIHSDLVRDATGPASGVRRPDSTASASDAITSCSKATWSRCTR